nr:EOG090X06Q3 [Triops cancriformis]
MSQPYFRTKARKGNLSHLLRIRSVMSKLFCLNQLIRYYLLFESRVAVAKLSVATHLILTFIFSKFWTLFTHCFVEFHFWEVCVDIITVGLCGKLIEPLWGAWEMMKFFALVNLCSGILSTFFYMVLYMATQNTEVLFDIHIHGLAGYLAAVAVAVKQMMPDHVLLRTPLGKLTNRNVPLCVSLASIPLWLIGILEGTYPTMFMSGVLISWIYLRFYQKHSNGTRGDMADNFTFASFFPNVLQPPMDMVASALYSLLVRLKVCRKPVRKYDVGAPTAITISLPGTEPQDAERRRMLCFIRELKATSEKLLEVSKVLIFLHFTNFEILFRSLQTRFFKKNFDS